MEIDLRQPWICTSSTIPPEMLSSPCAVRMSFRMPFQSRELVPIEDYRYSEWEDKMHHDHTGHSLELSTNKVSPCVVHTLIRSCPDGKLVELSAHCRHPPAEKRFCNCVKNDVTFIHAILSSRFAVHRRFHELRLPHLPRPSEPNVKLRYTSAERQALIDRLKRKEEEERQVRLKRKAEEEERQVLIDRLKRKAEEEEATGEHLAAVPTKQACLL